MKKSIYSLLVPALLAGAAVSARAQTDADARPVTLNVSQSSVQSVLRTLFAGAGIRNFTLDSDIQGTVNMSLDGVPFSVALKQVLGAVTPPLAADLRNGVYHVHARSSALPVEILADFPAAAADTGESRFYKIGIKHYDARVLADAMTHPGGIILLPPNFVIPANPAAPTSLNPPGVTTVGGQGAGLPGTGMPGLAATLPGLNTPAVGPGGGQANNVLPPGVKRIFVLQSDNSLVVEATPDGFDNLTGSQLLSGGYTQVY